MSDSQKTALITGAAQGIGLAIAEYLAAEDITVIIADINKDAADAAADELRGKGGQAFPVFMDVSDPSSVETAVTGVERETGGINILVNNAGFYPVASLLEMAPEEWDEVIRVNLHGVHHCTRAAASRMIETGRTGVIVPVIPRQRAHGNTSERQETRQQPEQACN